jgi:hypothetical protein
MSNPELHHDQPRGSSEQPAPRARRLEDVTHQTWIERFAERVVDIVKFHDPPLTGPSNTRRAD